MNETKNGVTTGTFVIGVAVAILVSCLVSTLVSLQCSFGPKGEQGIAGQNGLNGVQGLQGSQGIRGEQGLPGVQGEQGIQGLKGDNGPQGPEGDASLENIAGWLPRPAYDSGWTLISGTGWHNFTHNLNTKELVVHMLGKTETGDIYQVGNYGSGSSAYWRIATPNEILVVRATSQMVLVRVLAWKIVTVTEMP